MFWGSLSPRSLLNPQRLNSYSYARDNPIKRKDPSGLYDINTGLIQKGDTLSAIASQINKAWGTTYTVSSLAAQNGITNVNLIYAGNYIYYTMPGAAVVSDGTSISSSSSSAVASSSSSTASALSTGLTGLTNESIIGAAIQWVGRGGDISAEGFTNGRGVIMEADGTLSGVSVYVGINNESRAQVLDVVQKRFAGDGGVSPDEAIKEIGGEMVQDGKNAYHYLISKLTPNELEELFSEAESGAESFVGQVESDPGGTIGAIPL